MNREQTEHILNTEQRALDAIRPYFLHEVPNWNAASGKFLMKLAGGPDKSLSAVIATDKIPLLLYLLECWGNTVKDTPLQMRKRCFEQFEGVMHLKLNEWRAAA